APAFADQDTCDDLRRCPTLLRLLAILSPTTPAPHRRLLAFARNAGHILQVDKGEPPAREKYHRVNRPVRMDEEVFRVFDAELIAIRHVDREGFERHFIS